MSSFDPKKELADARAEEKRGRRNAASKRYAKVADYLIRRGKNDEALPLLDRAIRLAPTAPRLYLEKALCQAGLGKIEDALDASGDFARAAVHKRKAREYLPKLESLLKDYPELRERFYRVMLELDRTDAAPFLGLARACREQKRTGEAKQVLIEALEAGTSRRGVIAMLREVLEAANQMDALFYLQRFEKGELTRQEIILMLADPGHIPRSDPSEEGEMTLGKMIRGLEDELGISIQDDRAEIAPLLEEFGRRAEPILAADDRTRLDMAVAYFEMGLVSQAIEQCERVPSTSALAREARFLAGEFLFREERFLEALEVFKAALRDDALNETMWQEAMYRAAVIYFNLGDLRRAWEHAEALAEQNEEYRELRGLRARIAERISRMKQSA